MVKSAFASNRYLRNLLLWGGFIVLWLYVITRAFITEPLHDETATFFHYIETGKIFGSDIILDANNHLINSLFGHWAYSTFGDHFFLYRLPAVLGFPLYFFGLWRIAQLLKLPWPALTTVCIASIPYTLEYFGYSRGYGLALGALIFSFAYLLEYLRKTSPIKGVVCALSAIVASWSVVSFLLPALVILMLLGINHLLHFRRISVRLHIEAAVIVVLFILALIPLIHISADLKAAGSLYYGSLDGLWLVTGKSLTGLVLFTKGAWLKWCTVLFLLLLFCKALYELYSKGLQRWFVQPEAQLTILVGTLLAGFWLMAKLLKINYPEDRVAMYLVPLVILLFLSGIKRVRLGQLVALFFPVTLITHLTLHSSVFSPDERLSSVFFNQVYAQLKLGMTLGGYHTGELNWQLHQRRKPVKYLFQSIPRFTQGFDVVIMKDTFVPPITNGYSKIAVDEGSGYVALKRHASFSEETLSDHWISSQTSSDEFVGIWEGNTRENWRNRHLKVNIAGSIRTTGSDILNLVISTEGAEGSIKYYAFDLRRNWSIGARHVDYEVNCNLGILGKEDTRMKFYLWNPRKVQVMRGKTRVRIIALRDGVPKKYAAQTVPG